MKQSIADKIETLKVIAQADRAGQVMLDFNPDGLSMDGMIARVLAVAAMTASAIAKSCPREIDDLDVTRAQNIVGDDALAKAILELFWA